MYDSMGIFMGVHYGVRVLYGLLQLGSVAFGHGGAIYRGSVLGTNDVRIYPGKAGDENRRHRECAGYDHVRAIRNLGIVFRHRLERADHPFGYPGNGLLDIFHEKSHAVGTTA